MKGKEGKAVVAKKINVKKSAKNYIKTKEESKCDKEHVGLQNVFEFLTQFASNDNDHERSSNIIAGKDALQKMKENLLSSGYKQFLFIEDSKGILTSLEISDCRAVVDFCFKYFRKIIDELEKLSNDELKKVIISCEYVYKCVDVIWKQSKTVLTEEMCEKAVKIFFHILKHFYKKSCIEGMITINKAVVQLLTSAAIKGIENKIELKKILFTMHQMAYSVYTKSLQSMVKNKSMDVTSLFNFRTKSLIILLFSEWREGNFIEHMNDYFKRWLKILTHSYKFEVEFVSTVLTELIHCLCYHAVADKNKTPKLKVILWNVLFIYLVVARKDENKILNKKMLSLLSKINTLFPVITNHLNLLSLLCSVDEMLSSFISTPSCVCEQNNGEILSTFSDCLFQLLPEEEDCGKMYTIISFVNGQLKEHTLHCIKVIEMFQQLTCTFLSSEVLQKDLDIVQCDFKKQKLGSLCMLTINSLRDLEYIVFEDENNTKKCKHQMNVYHCKSFSSYFETLKNFSTKYADSIEVEYLKCVWASCYKIGMKLYQKQQSDNALKFFLLAYHMKTLSIAPKFRNILQHLKETCSISSALASCYCQKKQFEDGYEFLLQHSKYIICCMQDVTQCSELETLLQTQLDRLVSVKLQLHDVTKNVEERTSLLARCLLDEVSESSKNNSAVSSMVAKLEYDCYEKRSQRYKVHAVLQRLIEFQKNIHEKSGNLLDYSFSMIKLSTLAGFSRKERFYWCKEAIEMLEEMLDSLLGDDNIEYKIRDALALSYFQQAIILYEEKVAKEIIDDDCNNDVNNSLDNSDNISSEILDDFQLNNGLQSDFLLILASALDMWLQVIVFIKDHEIQVIMEYFYDVTYSAHCLKQAAVLYSLQSQNFQAMQAAYLSGYLYERLHEECGNGDFHMKKISSWTILATQLVCVDSMEIGEWVLEKLVQPEEHVTSCSRVDTVMAAYFMKKGEIDKSLEVLRNIFTDSTMEVNTKTTLLLKSEAFFLLSSLKLNGAACNKEFIQDTDHHYPISSPFPPVLDCIKYLRSLFETNVESEKYDNFSCWLTLDKLLLCLTRHAELLGQQGSIMEARSYLKEALLLATKYHLPFRVLEIVEKICGIDIVLENVSSFENNFNYLCSILSNSVGNCFHDDTIYLPDFVDHSLECCCTYCYNPKLQESHIQLFLQYINGRMTFHDAVPHNHMHTKAIDDLTQNANRRFVTCMEEVKCLIGYQDNSGSQKRRKTAKPTVNEEIPMFSKYIVKAKVLSKEAVNYSSAMIGTVEQLISKLEMMKPVENAEHDFQRLVAQLYYLRKMIYLGSNDHRHDSNPEHVFTENQDENIPMKGNTVHRRSNRRKTKTRSVKGKVKAACEKELENKMGMLEIKEQIVDANKPTDRLLCDLKKVLTLLNSYTDTLIIKSIYQLISLITSEYNKQLSNNCLFLSFARTLHQQVLNSVTKKLRKRSDSAYALPLREERKLLGTAELIDAYSRPDFVFNENVLKKVLKEIPKDWTVCCLTLSRIKSDEFMIVSRVQVDFQPSLVKIKLNGANEERRSIVCDLASAFDESIETKFRSILEESKASMTIKDKKSWWSERRRLDYRMKSLVNRMENEWLKGWKGLLLGQPVDQCIFKHMQNVASRIVEEIRNQLKVSLNILDVARMVDGFQHCTPFQLLDSFQYLCGGKIGEKACAIFVKMCEDHLKLPSDEGSFIKRKPVVLILDKVLQALPWESMPILRNQPVVRMPSILLTSSHCKNNKEMLKKGMCAKDVYYVVNPRNDLKRTEDMFVDWFERENWTGIVGKPPTSEEYTNALTENDLFIYCGHGSGQEYLGWDAIQRLQCKSVALLMGCSSGKLVCKGTLEARGMAQYYILAGSPAVVANLWDVTDKDIDLFLERLLKLWLTESSGQDLAECVAEARKQCKLEYLIGAAPVVYGLPLFAIPTKT